MALALRLTLRSHGRQTVVLREISTHPRSGERSYIKVSANDSKVGAIRLQPPVKPKNPRRATCGSLF